MAAAEQDDVRQLRQRHAADHADRADDHWQRDRLAEHCAGHAEAEYRYSRLSQPGTFGQCTGGAIGYYRLIVDRIFLTLAALSACLAVAAGAFGAHALRDRLSADMLQVFQTGVTYQMYHALGLLAVGILLARLSPTVDGSVWLTGAGSLFIAGSVLFSGSLYALSLTGISWLGAITPLGGLAFLLGWLALAIGIWR